MKSKYYIVWIEGFSARGGEKLLTLDANDHTYTTKMTEALRVKHENIGHVKELLEKQQIADWVLESPNTFVPTSYAPKGTIFKKVD